jgi:hypothetical protein
MGWTGTLWQQHCVPQQQSSSLSSTQQPQVVLQPPQQPPQHFGMGRQNGSHSTLKQGRVTFSVPHSTTQYALHGALHPHFPQQSDLPQQPPPHAWSQHPVSQQAASQHPVSQHPVSQLQQSPAAAGKAKTRLAATANNMGINLITRVSFVYASCSTLRRSESFP